MSHSTCTQQIHHVLSLNRQGSAQTRAKRKKVLLGIVADWSALGFLPTNFTALIPEHVRKLVRHWQRKQQRVSTIAVKLSILRQFIEQGGWSVEVPTNHTLGLTHVAKHTIDQTTWDDLVLKLSPISQSIGALQVLFGLSVHESINIDLSISRREDALWLYRDLAFNNIDRHIPIITPAQQQALDAREALCNQSTRLDHMITQAAITRMYHTELSFHGLSSMTSFRHCYAKARYQALIRQHDQPIALRKVQQEMGYLSVVPLKRLLA